MSARDRYLTKALNELGVQVEDWVNNVKDVEVVTRNMENAIGEMEVAIVTANEIITQAKSNIETLEAVIHQTKVERYKELNPDKDIF